MKALSKLLKGIGMLIIKVSVLSIYGTAKISESLSKVIADSAESYLKEK